MEQQLRRLRETWDELSAARKALLAATAALLVGLGVVAYSWSSSTRYVTLYSGLGAADSGAIVEQLRSRDIPFELSAGGTGVLVPENQVDELRIGFAAQGLPEGGHVGFEIFESNAFTATDFVQRLNFQRGLQGELARTIETFPAVERARVHVVLPERSLFRDDERPTTASVVLRLTPGRSLAQNEVAGIAHLVSGSVEGLDKSSVTIIDSSGAMLFDGTSVGSEAGLGVSASQLDLQRQYERSVERDVQAVLDRALGPAKAVVSVRANLNFDRNEVETESYLPVGEEGVPRSSTSVRETYAANGGAAAGAVPGAVANVPGANADLPAADAESESETSTSYERTETTSNYELGRTVTRRVDAVGGVERLSVSLLLDESVTEAQATALEASVGAAAGIDESRGDRLVVNRVPFDRSAIDEALESFEAQQASDELMGYIRLALPAVLLLVAFVFFRLLMRSIDRRSYRAVTVSDGSLYAGVQQALEAGDDPAAVLKAATAAVQPLPSPEEVRTDLEVQVEKLARTHPESVAEVVQSWLRED